MCGAAVRGGWTSAAVGCVGGDGGSAVGFSGLLDDREPESGSRHAAGVVGSVEAIEDVLEVARGKPGSVVSDSERSSESERSMCLTAVKKGQNQPFATVRVEGDGEHVLREPAEGGSSGFRGRDVVSWGRSAWGHGIPQAPHVRPSAAA